MRGPFTSRTIFTAAAAVVAMLMAVLWWSGGSMSGQQSAADYRAPRLDGTPSPDLSGIWQAVNTANYNVEGHDARAALAVRPGPGGGEMPHAAVLALGAVGGVPAGLSVVEGGPIPYQPWAVERRDENAANWLTRDPEIKCYLPGVPRATYLPYPFQIAQSTNKIMILYEFANANRTIHLDRSDESPIESWMGHSIGRWDGETLVVEASGFNDRTWFDRAGNFHSEALRVTERYTPMSPHHLEYVATIEDPKVFTRPWTMRMTLYRRTEPNAQVLEYKCVEFVEELMYGHLRREPYGVASDYTQWYRESRLE